MEKNNNITLKRFLEFGFINDREFDLLFEDKTSWDASDSSHLNKAKNFWAIFAKVKDKMSKNKTKSEYKLSPYDSTYNFTYIVFPDMTCSSIKEEYTVTDYESYTQEFEKDVDFSNAIFCSKTDFSGAIFSDEVKFNNTIFKGNADFSEITFEADTYFKSARFEKIVTFENSECKDNTFDFSDVKFNNLNLEKTIFNNASYLNLSGLDNNKNELLSKKHFFSKETARIIKAQFEEQKNIRDANKFFNIEQNFFIEDIKNEINYNMYKKFIILFPLYLDKYVSDFGTNWLRVLFIILCFSFFVHFFYDNLILGFSSFNDISKILKIDTLDRMVHLINPLNIFKKDIILYKDAETLGMIIRVTTVYFFWQFAKSFRINTKLI